MRRYRGVIWQSFVCWIFPLLCPFTRVVPLKSDIEFQNSHVWKEIHFANHRRTNKGSIPTHPSPTALAGKGHHSVNSYLYKSIVIKWTKNTPPIQWNERWTNNHHFWYLRWISGGVYIYMMAASGLPVPPPEWVGSKTYVLATFSWNPPKHMVFTLFWQARPPKPWYLQRFVILHCILLLL